MTIPVVVMRPIEPKTPIAPFPLFVYHSAPSGPAVIAKGATMLGAVKFVTLPVVVIRPIELLPVVREPECAIGTRDDSL